MSIKADVPLCTGCGCPEGTVFPPPAIACCPEPLYLSHRQLALLYETAKREIMDWKQRAEAAEAEVARLMRWCDQNPQAQSQLVRDLADDRDAAVKRAEAAEKQLFTLGELRTRYKAMAERLPAVMEERDAARAEVERLREAILRVLDDDESQPGGWGPDVTMQSVLREALAATKPTETDHG